MLELPEAWILADAASAWDVIRGLKDSGVRLALTDFGNSCSSLGHLQRLPIDMVQIAESLVADLGVAGSDTRLMRAIIDVGHVFGVSVVAKGVTSAVQADRLSRLRCSYGQGDYFASPVPSGELLATCDRVILQAASVLSS